MNTTITKEMVSKQIEVSMNKFPKTIGKSVRKLTSEKGFTDEAILQHLGNMFRVSILIAAISFAIVTLYMLFVNTHAYLFAGRSLEGIKSHFTIELCIYLVFMVPAIIYVINAFSIYKARIIYTHVLSLRELMEEKD